MEKGWDEDLVQEGLPSGVRIVERVGITSRLKHHTKFEKG